MPKFLSDFISNPLFHLNFGYLFLALALVATFVVVIIKLFMKNRDFLLDWTLGLFYSLIATILLLAASSVFIEWPEGRKIYAKNSAGRWGVYERPVFHTLLGFQGITKADTHLSQSSTHDIRVLNSVTGVLDTYEAEVSSEVINDDEHILTLLNKLDFKGDSGTPTCPCGGGSQLDVAIKKATGKILTEVTTQYTGQSLLSDGSRTVRLTEAFSAYGLKFIDCKLTLRVLND